MADLCTNDFTDSPQDRGPCYYRSSVREAPRAWHQDVEHTPVCTIDMASHELEELLLEGFYPPEESRFRWMAPRGVLLLSILPESTHIILKGYAAESLFREGPLSIEIAIDGEKAGRFVLHAPGGFLVPVPLDGRFRGRPVHIPAVVAIEVRTMSGKRAQVGAGSDERALGLILELVGTGRVERGQTRFDQPVGTSHADRAQPPHPFFVSTCPVCGKQGPAVLDKPYLHRESMRCVHCGASNRIRQLARAFLRDLTRYGIAVRNVAELAARLASSPVAVLDTDSNYSMARLLRGSSPRYVVSELYPDVPLGAERGGVQCQDLTRLTFEDGAFDIVLSSDVLEHVRLYRRALADVYRVLRPGGSWIFNVPSEMGFEDHREFVRIEDEANPGRDSFVGEPVYHGDPIRKDGALLYRVYGRRLFAELEECGFAVEYERVTVRHLGIYDCEVFTCTKPSAG